MDEQEKKRLDSIVKTEFPGLIQMLEQNLDFERWGFKRAFSGVGQFTPIIIYESQACRVMFSWHEPQHLHDSDAAIKLYYGRLHAPNDEEIITWKDQKCYCWHDVNKALYFLDGLSATEAVKNKFGLPKVMKQFRESTNKTGLTQLERTAKMHAAIWEHYGQRLFDLLDLRQPSLWEEYSRFVAEYRRLDPDYSAFSKPARDKVC